MGVAALRALLRASILGDAGMAVGHGLCRGVPRGGRGRLGQRWCSSGIEEEEDIGVARTMSSVEEEDGAIATNGGAGGGGALSAWAWLGR